MHLLWLGLGLGLGELQEISEAINELQDDITDQEVLTDQIVPSSEAKEFTEDETAAILDESEQSLEVGGKGATTRKTL